MVRDNAVTELLPQHKPQDPPLQERSWSLTAIGVDELVEEVKNQLTWCLLLIWKKRFNCNTMITDWKAMLKKS